LNKKLENILFCKVSPLSIAVFRIVFGFFGLLEVIYFYKTYLIEDYILQPKFLFNYSFLPVKPFSEGVLDILLALLLVSTILIVIGKFYRVAISFFFIVFSYFLLLDKSYYNNHLYLFSLIAFLLIFIPADSALSLKNKKKRKPTLGWHLRILQFQFVVVYFFGGVAKINGDWLLHYEPVTSILKGLDVHSDFLAIFLTYGGLLFDLCIGFFLLAKRTRIYAVFLVLVFNISNHIIFDDINIFPFFMLASLVLFFEVNKFSFLSKKQELIHDDKSEPSKVVIYALAVYVLIQVLMPLRHIVIPGNVDWTGEGGRFAWRMKIQSRGINVCEFAIFDMNAKKIYPVNVDLHIHPVQKRFMTHYPKMVLDFAHYLEGYARKKHGLTNVMVKAKINVQFNQRESVEVLSPNIDLTKEKWNSFGHNEWINPLPN